MNTDQILGLFWLLLIVVSYSLYFSRKTFSSEQFKLRLALSGSGLALGATLNWLTTFPNYSRWFLPEVYLIFEWVFVACIAFGVITLLWGLIGGTSSASVESVSSHDNSYPDSLRGIRQSVESFQSAESIHSTRDLRAALGGTPSLLELGELALNNLASELALGRGALYLYNTQNTQLALLSSHGLAPHEQALLERLQADDPLVSEALAGSSLTILTVEPGAYKIPERFALAIPFVSQSEILGLALFLSELPVVLETVTLGKARRQMIQEMSEVIADHLRLARLRGDLHREKVRSARELSQHENWLNRVNAVHHALDAGSDYDEFCQALSGIGGADAVGLFMRKTSDRTVTMAGSSSGFPELNAGYRRTISQALLRTSPALLNQRRQVEGSEKSEVQSVALVAPLALGDASSERAVLLLWNRNGEYRLSKDEYARLTALFGSIGPALKQRRRSEKLERSREALQAMRDLLLKVSGSASAGQSIRDFFQIVSSALPESSVALLFENESRGRLTLLETHGVTREAVSNLVVLPGEGALGRSAALGVESIEVGRERLRERGAEYDVMNRDIFGDGFSAFGAPQAEIIIPLSPSGRVEYIFAAYLPEESSAADTMTVCSALALAESLLLRIQALNADQRALQEGHGRKRELGLLINSLNNDLLSIVGNCQMAERDPNISGLVERALKVARESAEHASATLESETVHFIDENTEVSEDSNVPGQIPEGGSSLTEVLREFAGAALIGGQILLAEGKARELTLDLQNEFVSTLPLEDTQTLIKFITLRFSAGADESESVTIKSQHDGAYQYLTLSRHHRNFPPLSITQRLGQFSIPAYGALGIPSALIGALRIHGVELAVDSENERPAFVALRAPAPARKPVPEISEQLKSESPRAPLSILAIDDQAVILDLLQAMCQSQGYSVDTFTSPHAALSAFDKKKYDIIISDIRMPELSGWDVARYIHERRPETSVIFITGWSEGVEEAELAALGVDEVLHKPFRVEQLIETLERVSARISI